MGEGEKEKDREEINVFLQSYFNGWGDDAVGSESSWLEKYLIPCYQTVVEKYVLDFWIQEQGNNP